jgi:transcription antitermination factor NusG
MREADARRWCLHVKPRQEKAVARDMRFRDVSYYLPQVVNIDRTPQGRKIRSVIPLFPGYLFLIGDDSARIPAQDTNRRANVLTVVDQDRLIHDLKRIHRMLSSGLTVVPEPVMAVGTRVRIRSGPLMGVEGTVFRGGKADKFVAVVRFLGRGAAVDLEDWQVERLDDRSDPLSMLA